jgi:hypothetical protein
MKILSANEFLELLKINAANNDAIIYTAISLGQIVKDRKGNCLYLVERPPWGYPLHEIGHRIKLLANKCFFSQYLHLIQL